MKKIFALFLLAILTMSASVPSTHASDSVVTNTAQMQRATGSLNVVVKMIERAHWYVPGSEYCKTQTECLDARTKYLNTPPKTVGYHFSNAVDAFKKAGIEIDLVEFLHRAAKINPDIMTNKPGADPLTLAILTYVEHPEIPMPSIIPPGVFYPVNILGNAPDNSSNLNIYNNNDNNNDNNIINIITPLTTNQIINILMPGLGGGDNNINSPTINPCDAMCMSEMM